MIKVISEIIKNEAKEQKGRFFSMLLGKLNLLTSKVMIRAGESTFRVASGTVIADQDF